MFLLENNELLCLEYESKVSWLDFLKYTEYVNRKIRQLFTEGIRVHKVIIAVIYTADVKSTSAELDLCGLHIKIEQVFLSKFDTNALYAGLKAKIESGEKLSDEDIMRFIILPLTQPNKIRKQKLIKETVDLAKQVKNEDQQAFILAGILTAADKFIDQKFAESVREWLKMSKVIRLFIEEGIEQGIEQGKKAKAIETALELLKLGLSIDIISKGTNLPESEIEQLQLQTTKTVNA
jgi:predicted transposase/invertase (TIGR01784 family)